MILFLKSISSLDGIFVVPRKTHHAENPMNSIFKLLFILLLLTFGFDTTAQNFYKERISRDNVVTFGIGPSFGYLDNGGQYRDYNFAIKPAFSLALTRKLNSLMELRTTGGIQWISSGGNPPIVIRDNWYFSNASFTAKGPAYYFDILPSFYLILN